MKMGDESVVAYSISLYFFFKSLLCGCEMDGINIL